MRVFSGWCLVVVGMLTLSLSHPAVAETKSGPKAGAKVKSLKVYAVTGTHENKEVDYVADREERATVYVFMQATEFDRPMARFLRKLDQYIQNGTKEIYVVGVWMTDDKEKTKTYLPRVDQSLKLRSTAFTLYPDAMTGPDGWNISQKARVTVVVVNEKKVHGSFAFDSINETDIPKVTKVIEKSFVENEINALEIELDKLGD